MHDLRCDHPSDQRGGDWHSRRHTELKDTVPEGRARFLYSDDLYLYLLSYDHEPLDMNISGLVFL